MISLISPLVEFKEIELDRNIIPGAKDLAISEIRKIMETGLAN